MYMITEGTHDYYDGIMATDDERDVKYIRKPRHIVNHAASEFITARFAEWPLLDDRFATWCHTIPGTCGDYRRWESGIDVTRFVIGFCGKLYCGLITDQGIMYPGDNYPRLPARDHNGFPQTATTRRKYLQAKNGFAKHMAKSFNAWKPFINISIFFDLDTPIFSLEYNRDIKVGPKLTINALLLPFDFQRVFGAPQAYQEINNFVSGVLSSTIAAPQIVDDKVLVVTKGFDLKTSFRTIAPGAKKERRKLNRLRKKKKG